MPPLNDNEIATLYVKYREQIYRYLYSLAGNEATASELVQEVFLKIVEHKEFYRGDQNNFIYWAFIAARNTYFNYHRREKRFQPIRPEQLDELTASPESIPEQIYETKLLKKMISTAIICLPEPEKSVFIYREFQNKTLLETAKLLKLSARTVSRKTINAVKLVREKLKTEGIEL